MKRNYQNRGFTIVELLTVMAVIAMLIGLLVPAISKVRSYAKGVRQKAQFHSMTVALEMFKNDIGEYPESSYLPTSGGNRMICGANRLAEALVGRDLQGYDPVSKWHPDTDIADNTYAYSTNTGGGTPSFQQQSIERRKGPYLTLQSGGAFNACQFFGNTTTRDLYPGSDQNPPTMPSAPMLSDIYVTKNIQYTVQTTSGTISTTAKAGMPVLYFRANVSATKLDWMDPANSFYNYTDNVAIFDCCYNLTPTKTHPFYDSSGSGHWEPFYNKITNPAASTGNTANALRPYNTDSFILLSAGNDAIYGTTDDVYNFGE